MSATKRKRKSRDDERMRKIDLARALTLSRVSLDKYLNREGAPSPDGRFRYSVEEVAAFIAKQKVDDSKVKGKSHWEAEKARLQCEKLAEEMARERGDFIPRADLERAIPPLITELADMMTAKFVRELPSRYKGHDAVECAAMNQAACDAIAERFRVGAKGFA